jgi:hypothetical protein
VAAPIVGEPPSGAKFRVGRGFGLSHNPSFIEIINRSWASHLKDGGIPLEEMRRRHVPLGRRRRRPKAR